MDFSKSKGKIKKLFHDWVEGISIRNCIIGLLASALMAFGIYNIHAISDVTEGGVLGMTLLLEYWLGLSPAISGFALNILCYLLGWKLLGKQFIVYSIVSTFGFSFAYGIFEQFAPVFPEIAHMPFTASIAGAIFIGVSAGICVRIGGAPSGDDALAMSLSKVLRVEIQWIYLASDLLVLLLSLSYIPFHKIGYSLLTVILSGQIVGIIQKIKNPRFRKIWL